LDYALVRDSLKLVQNIDKLPDVDCKLENSNKVAYTEAKAHRELEDGAA